MKFLFHEFTMNSLSFSQIHYKFTIFFAIFFGNIQWILYLFAKSLKLYYLFDEFTMNFLCLRISYESIIFFVNFQSMSQIHYQPIIVFANSHNLGQYTTTSQSCSRISYSLSISRIKFEFTFCFAYRL